MFRTGGSIVGWLGVGEQYVEWRRCPASSILCNISLFLPGEMTLSSELLHNNNKQETHVIFKKSFWRLDQDKFVSLLSSELGSVFSSFCCSFAFRLLGSGSSPSVLSLCL